MESYNHSYEINESSFPRYARRGEKLKFLLRYAALAYSPFNSQPWQFKIKHDLAEIHVDLNRKLEIRDPDNRQILLSCGAAIGNLIVACRYFGYEPNVNLLTGKLNATLVGTIGLGALVEPSSEYLNWFECLTQIEHALIPFRKGPTPATLTPVIARIAKNYRTRVKSIDQNEKSLQKITSTAIEREQSDQAYRQELNEWLRKGANGNEDGLTPSYFGMGTLGSFLGKHCLRYLTSSTSLLKTYKQLFHCAAGGFIINTENDNPDLVLESGIVLQHSLLAIRSQGLMPVVCQPPLNMNRVRQDIGTRFCDGRMPQSLLLFGWAKKQGVILPKRDFESLFSSTSVE